MGSTPSTIIDKLWDSHAVLTREDGQTLLWIDRHLLHEGSFHAFDQLAKRGAAVAHPELTFGIADHYVPTRRGAGDLATPEIRRMVEQLSDNTAKHGIRLIGLDDPRQGIVHVAIPSRG